MSLTSSVKGIKKDVVPSYCGSSQLLFINELGCFCLAVFFFFVFKLTATLKEEIISALDNFFRVFIHELFDFFVQLQSKFTIRLSL